MQGKMVFYLDNDVHCMYDSREPAQDRQQDVDEYICKSIQPLARMISQTSLDVHNRQET